MVVSRVLTEVKRCLQVRRHVEAIVSSALDLLGDLEQSDAALEPIRRCSPQWTRMIPSEAQN